MKRFRIPAFIHARLKDTINRNRNKLIKTNNKRQFLAVVRVELVQQEDRKSKTYQKLSRTQTMWKDKQEASPDFCVELTCYFV